MQRHPGTALPRSACFAIRRAFAHWILRPESSSPTYVSHAVALTTIGPVRSEHGLAEALAGTASNIATASREVQIAASSDERMHALRSSFSVDPQRLHGLVGPSTGGGSTGTSFVTVRAGGGGWTGGGGGGGVA